MTHLILKGSLESAVSSAGDHFPPKALSPHERKVDTMPPSCTQIYRKVKPPVAQNNRISALKIFEFEYYCYSNNYAGKEKMLTAK